MREKPGLRTSFFSTHTVDRRPQSVYTEFDWEVDEQEGSDIESEIEDDVDCGVEDGENSPRISVGSVSLSCPTPV